ncbi:hypothetical protein Ciccas_011887 [Cichlidogyrus casuarinus]|uniref:Uncharacterized protein n=1 Tax=Cichlidogyrus casuarinus TaxID=1844966 RepID=A0ABD2PT05_9PLAT
MPSKELATGWKSCLNASSSVVEMTLSAGEIKLTGVALATAAQNLYQPCPTLMFQLTLPCRLQREYPLVGVDCISEWSEREQINEDANARMHNVGPLGKF